MNKIKNFFCTLSKSTRITLISCGSFVLMTLIILCFFVLFPITPSERIISGLGREGLAANSSSTTTVTTAVTIDTNSVVTTAVTIATYNPNATMMTFTTRVFSTDVNYVYSGYGIPTDDGYNESETTTVSEEDTSQVDENEPIVTTAPDNTDNDYVVTTAAPVVDEPVEPTAPPTEPPVETTDPPVEVTDPPAEVTDPPVEDPPIL